MDIESRNRCVEYSKSKDTMFSKAHMPEAPWFAVEANEKRRARLNCLRHILSRVPYEDMTTPPIKMSKRPKQGSYKRPPLNEQFFVPNNYPYKSYGKKNLLSNINRNGAIITLKPIFTHED